MTVRSKTGTAALQHQPGKPNLTRQGSGARSKPSHGRKLMRGERKEEWKMANHGEKQMTCGCLEKMYHNVMLPNGDVSLCCMDYGLKHILGNLYEQDYEEIIPENNQCFELCRLCENAVEP
jgi:hypothetical protein